MIELRIGSPARVAAADDRAINSIATIFDPAARDVTGGKAKRWQPDCAQIE